jgi:hypothetical protein
MHAMENGEEASRREPGRETSGLLSARTSVKKLAVQPRRSGGIICPLSDSNWKRLSQKDIKNKINPGTTGLYTITNFGLMSY